MKCFVLRSVMNQRSDADTVIINTLEVDCFLNI
jgi:hypothetical protein